MPPPRVPAQLLRLRTQGVVWAFAAVLTAAAAWGGHWSPAVLDLAAGQGDPVLTVSVAGAVAIAAAHIATGLGVALAAVLVAAGPGRDFADGSAEVQRANGSRAVRLASRVVAVMLGIVACGAVLAAAYVAAGVAVAVRDHFTIDVRPGRWQAGRVGAGVLMAGVHATWVLALAQRLRTQASQLALPLAATMASLLVSRLSPYPVTPDSWLGPLLGLRAGRGGLDYWWSVGGDVAAPWGNVLLLAVALGMAVVIGLRGDRRQMACAKRKTRSGSTAALTASSRSRLRP